MHIYTRKLLRFVREAQRTKTSFSTELREEIKANHDQFRSKVISDIFKMELLDRVEVYDSNSFQSGPDPIEPFLKLTFSGSIDNTFLTLVFKPGNQSSLEIGIQPSDKGLESMLAYELDDMDSDLYRYRQGSAYKRYFAYSKIISEDKCSLQYQFSDRQLCGRHFDEYVCFIVGHALPFIKILYQLEERVSLAA